MQKTIKQCICYFIIAIITLTTLSGCGKNSEEDLLKEKLTSEMKYLDSTITSMLNNANGLNFDNYTVKSEKIEEKSQSSDSNQSSSSGNESEGSQGEQGGQDTSDGGDSSQNSQEKSDNKEYKMEANTIIGSERKSDWDSLTKDVESLYSQWSVITLDLYKQNIDGQSILGFNTDLDTVAKTIKDEDKQQTLTVLAKLYSYIPIYFSAFSNDTMQSELYKIKSNVLNAYSIIEQNNLRRSTKSAKIC